MMEGARLAKGLSEVLHDVPQSNAKGLRDFQKRVNRDGAVSILHLADVNGMKVGFFRELLLAHARFLSVLANILANEFAVFGNGRHRFLRKQEAANEAISGQLKLAIKATSFNLFLPSLAFSP
jgi:hypothetical protein